MVLSKDSVPTRDSARRFLGGRLRREDGRLETGGSLTAGLLLTVLPAPAAAS